MLPFDPFRRIERSIRRVRDAVLVRPASNMWAVQREVSKQYPMLVQDFGDHRMVFDPNDDPIGKAILELGSWHRPQFESILAALREAGRLTDGKIFLDVGANIGTQTIYALASGAFSRVIAIEPDAANARTLQMNALLNGFEDRVDIVRAAAGAEMGTLYLNGHATNSGGHKVANAPNGGKSVPVKVVTIDSVLRDRRLDPSDLGLVWIDVEGFEAEAAAGMSPVVERAIPLCIEFNAHVYGRGKSREFFSHLAEHYAMAAVVSDQQIKFRPIAELSTPERTADILFA
ncbi:FkbM family methyltransferase [Mesorhizobium sp. M2D.F.Ca.ET.171.01.1.1]|nr:FkbM family methyltransferase [Mesorhizobium sp. M2D.F.Ca.ET.178.01.1.1]TGT10559.1 FkbM family methyltransferase [Mesorhizobium sp. M2D.F.Ca.ET.171.01.1.1]